VSQKELIVKWLLDGSATTPALTRKWYGDNLFITLKAHCRAAAPVLSQTHETGHLTPTEALDLALLHLRQPFARTVAAHGRYFPRVL
jgi:hypothetical protein